jgi:hypothetical protein
MHIGPSTPNLDLAEMLDMVAEKLRDQLSDQLRDQLHETLP